MVMNSKSIAILGFAAVVLAGCSVEDKEFLGFQEPSWGEANRATMAAQVINPNPEYDTLVPETSAETGSAAVDRYREGNVKQPERVDTRNGDGGGSR